MSVFERHPKATLAGILSFGLVTIVTVIELLPLYEADQGVGFMEAQIQDPAPAGLEAATAKPRARQIRMREHTPGLERDWTPIDHNMSRADSLEQRPYRFEVDDDGFIKPSRVHENPDLTIVFLGGSTTECLFVDADVRFPYLVGRKLEERLGIRINSYNGGRGGNNTMHNNFLLLAKVIPLNPDIVVMMENVNDIATMILVGSYWNDHAERSLVLDNQETVSKDPPPATPARRKTVDDALADLMRLALPNTWRTVEIGGRRLRSFLGWQTTGEGDPASVTDEFADIRGKRIEVDKTFKPDDMARSFGTFISIARAWGIHPILMTQANRAKDDPDPIVMKVFRTFESQHGVSPERFIRLLRQGNNVVRHTAKKWDVPLIDLKKHVPESSEYIYDLTHYNNTGSAFAAEIISAHLEPLIREQFLEKVGLKTP